MERDQKQIGIGQPAIREDGLQLDEHRAFQERSWSVERWSWLAFGAILVFALTGLAGGGGPLAHGLIRSDVGEIDYPRVSRWESSDDIVVTFAPAGAEHRLTIGPAFSDYFQIEDMQPAPERSMSSRIGEVFIFGTEAQAAAKITLHLRAFRFGIARYRLTVDGTAANVTTVVLP